MIPAAFEYERAASVDHAIELLAREDAKLLAGGHSLLPAMRLRLARPALLVDIGRLAELRYVREVGDRIAIGALTRHADVVRDPLLRAKCAVVAEAAAEIGDPQVRHRGTIGGSLAHGDPSADFATVTLALDAEFVIRGPQGERVVGAGSFFAGWFETAVGPRDVLTEIRVPKATGVYLKFSRRAHDWATVGVAAARVGDATRVALGSMGPTPLRAIATENALARGSSTAEAAEHADEGTGPATDVNGSADYRRHLARVLTRRALEQLGA